MRTGPARWLVLCALIAPINFIMALDRNSFTLSSPKIAAQFGFSYVQVSVIIASLVWSYAIFQIPCGWLVNRYGARSTLFLACLFWSMTTLVTPFAGSLIGFVCLRLAMGAFQAPDWTASIVAVNNWFTPANRSRGNAVLLGCLYLGSVASGPVTTEVTAAFGWTRCFFVFGMIGLLLSLVWVSVFRDHPPARMPAGRQADAAQPATAPVPALDRRVMLRLLRSPQVWALGGFYLCLLSVQTFFHATLPHYLMTERHLSYRAMGWVFGLPWFCLYLSVLASGTLADLVLSRSGSVWLARTLPGALGSALGGIALEAAALAPGTAATVAALCISLAAVGVCQVSIWSTVQGLTAEHAGILSGWTGFWGNLGGGIAPIGIAYALRGSGSWPEALLLPAAMGLLGSLCCLAARADRPIEVRATAVGRAGVIVS